MYNTSTWQKKSEIQNTVFIIYSNYVNAATELQSAGQ